MPVAVVTGGSSGIGAAVARLLAEKGWHCVLVARNEERLAEVADEIGGEYEVCDVGDREAVERMATEVGKRHSAVKLLVNNAGISSRGKGFVETDPEWIEQLLRINLLGAVWCLRAFLPALEADKPSHVVNVASVAGTVALPPGLYSASKHALVAFSRSLAASLPAQGIHVHTVNPGFVETPGFPQRGRLGSRLLERTIVEPGVRGPPDRLRGRAQPARDLRPRLVSSAGRGPGARAGPGQPPAGAPPVSSNP